MDYTLSLIAIIYAVNEKAANSCAEMGGGGRGRFTVRLLKICLGPLGKHNYPLDPLKKVSGSVHGTSLFSVLQ